MGQQFDRFSFFDGLEMEPVTQVNWSDYWRGVIPDGVVAEVGEEMRPYANSTGMYVYVSTGACIVDNHRGVNSALKIMPVNTADATYDRIDLLVARVVYGNENESYMELDILTGTPAIDPVAPTVTQSTGDIYEIALAEIYVTAEAITITESDVADLRHVFTAASQSISFINDDSVPLTKGMLVWLSRDNEGAVKRCPSGKAPIGVVTSDSIPVGSRGQVATISGRVVEVACSTKAIQIGDALVPSGTAGIAETGGGFAGGISLEAKDAGAVGNVKALLAVLSKIPYQNSWYLPDGVAMDQVIAAYQFVGRATEAEALNNLNEGASYPLTKSGDTVLWDSNTGFYIPGEASAGLNNATLNGLASQIVTAAFGFSGVGATASRAVPGVGLNSGATNLGLSSRLWKSGQGYSYYDKVVISGYAGGSRYTDGVLAGRFGTTLGAWYNGAELSISNTSHSYNNLIRTKTFGGQDSATNIPIYITALVFYTFDLTADQHLELANNIKALGGAGS